MLIVDLVARLEEVKEGGSASYGEDPSEFAKAEATIVAGNVA